MKEFYINTADLSASSAERLTAGDRVYLSGTVFTARDAAHKRMFQALKNDTPMPFPLKNAVIYYAGPTPAPYGLPIGSCGPTTSGRMDPYTPALLERGLVAMIGKGDRTDEVYEVLRSNGAVYFCAVGGAGALAAKCVRSCEVIAYEDLGCESVKRLTIHNFPLIVAIDSRGGSLFKREK